MSQVIIYRKDDGGVAVVHPTAGADLARVLARSVPEGAPSAIVELDTLPAYDSATRDRWRWDNGQVVIASPDLPALKTKLKTKIDADAGGVRLRYITDSPGQALTYDRKRREALQAIDDPAPTAQKYPVLAASIGIEVQSSGDAKADFDAVASMVIAKEVQWAGIAAQIEALRLGAKRAIDAAADVDAAYAAAQVVWP